MLTTTAIALAVLVSAGIIVIGSLYLAAPQRIVDGFGLPLPSLDATTRAWLRLKGIRDITSGVAVLTLLLTTNHRTTGILLLVFALIPLGDMTNVLASRGRRLTAFAVHGVTCAVMLFAALVLLRVL